MSFRRRIAVLEAGENSWKTVAGSLAGGGVMGHIIPSSRRMRRGVDFRPGRRRAASGFPFPASVPGRGAVRCARPHGP